MGRQRALGVPPVVAPGVGLSASSATGVTWRCVTAMQGFESLRE
ncbi:hypothetical protein QUB80_15400 [Chlorogloeopsis sp. ULAP01]|nr:hypothetical protein [Chlorogloeopsis sp. ULAP01]MDM9382087.1 hypothetical protein [Chlorogloeopsis sp. ULAP01]